MIDLNVENNRVNAELLLKGFWYSNLPDILDIEELIDDIDKLFDEFNNKTLNEFDQCDDGFVKDWKSIESPPYIRESGVEAITFYEFKKNKSLREMQIPNLVHHLSFVYNTLLEFDNIFSKLYTDEDNIDIIANSNSYLVFDDMFSIYSYDQDDNNFGIAGTFTTKNNKIHMSAMFDFNKKRYLATEADYLYSLKMDIESFFPSLYTHNFEKMADKYPYSVLNIQDKRYFSFLDKFHQRINNNQTKGVPAGIFSSHVAAELCMLCVDHEIIEYIKSSNISAGYIRYVDDLTFFSDSKSHLLELSPAVQNILNKYRLRINGNKTESIKAVYSVQPSYISEIECTLPFLKVQNEQQNVTLSDFYDMQKYIRNCLISDRASQVRSLLSIIQKRLNDESIKINDIHTELFYYLLKLAFEDQTLTCHIYRILDFLLESSSQQIDLIESLQRKSSKIDNEYPDTLLQIWYYYVLFKHCDDVTKTNMINNMKNRAYNPIVVSCMVSFGKQKNVEIFKYIRDTYKSEATVTDGEWKKHIMFSKWWLPLFKIKRYDEHNYDSFMCSNNFPNVLKVFSNHTPETDNSVDEDELFEW